MFLVPFFDLQNFILLVRTVPFLRKIIFISSYTANNNYFLLYELIQDLPYINMFAKFDENPAMTLQDIKKTKRYGRTDARTSISIKPYIKSHLELQGEITLIELAPGPYFFV